MTERRTAHCELGEIGSHVAGADNDKESKANQTSARTRRLRFKASMVQQGTAYEATLATREQNACQLRARAGQHPKEEPTVRGPLKRNAMERTCPAWWCSREKAATG